MTLQPPGLKRIQSLSKENMCKSPICFSEARARRSALLRDSSFISTDAKGSSDSYERALNTTSRSQGGNEGGRGGCNLLAPLRKLTTSTCLPINCPPSGERNEAIAATYTAMLMVEIHYPVCIVENAEHPTLPRLGSMCLS